MKSITHVAMGIAASLLLFHPTTPSLCLFAIAGGAVGGVVADIDSMDEDNKYDVLLGQILAYGILIVCLCIDYFNEFGMCQVYGGRNQIVKILSIICFFMLLVTGSLSKQMKFMHSLLGLMLFTVTVNILLPQLMSGFFIGYSIHLLLDVLGEKPILLFYPIRQGKSLGVLHESKLLDIAFMSGGLIVTILFIYNTCVPII